MATSSHLKLWRPRTRRGWVTLAIVLIVFLAAGGYAILAGFSNPLAAGPDEAYFGVPGPPANSSASAYFYPSQQPPKYVQSYVDGGKAVLVKSLANTGPFPVVIVGITPDSLAHPMVTISDLRPAVLATPGTCCKLDPAATFGVADFRPITIDSGSTALIAVHMWMRYCEYHGPGSGETWNSLRVQYTVLGFPHESAIPVGPYAVITPTDRCPGTGTSPASTG